MLNIGKLRTVNPHILFVGSDTAIIQSVLDFDYLSGKAEPSVKAIISLGKKNERLFFGRKEVLIPVYASYSQVPDKKKINYFFNRSSGRRTLMSTKEVIEQFPNVFGGVLFAENVPEKHSLELIQLGHSKNIFIIGPASVGLLIPSVLKLGAIGGTDVHQFINAHLFTSGDTAVFSSSGGMTNELINILSQHNIGISFALSFGGDRFPVIAPKDAFLAAQKDTQTKQIVYFGELGGYDEYELVALMKAKKITKPVIAYIGGTIGEMFVTPPQFGHAKAMAKNKLETAREKRKMLKKAGVKVGESFDEFVKLIAVLPATNKSAHIQSRYQLLQGRKQSLFTTTISYEVEGETVILNEPTPDLAKKYSYAYIVISMLLGRKVISKELEELTDLILKISVDNGPFVSGAINTIVTARAGKDLISSLAAGLLTIGPRFGGAVNEAARNWYTIVRDNIKASDFVEQHASKRKLILGIGHKQYSTDKPEPRVAALMKFAKTLKKTPHLDAALAIEKITTTKKSNLILNVDGTIAALLLDLLTEKEGVTNEEIEQLLNAEFFNALFILSRSVGFVAHYLDQKRLDEGLFRLYEDDVLYIKG